ncbi:hypothetical protein M3650_11485 [Paenibacillus sp. MER TA 81-3]|uniref:hypothetical protein n=1 Tax=Paenibacillus sp. MER TA 81-3 TaxID=2939573 RepID=UPI00203C357B|nr:hypothetical protein [Paenibacillus sp. MER TA 81-3]MCM3339241.1 hypothetical protein [Paenibacillus sp. MER TA 81-3]
MIGISVVLENKLGVFSKKELSASIRKSQDFFIDDLDFHTNSINDFYDYLEFHDVMDYVFISDGSRIKRFVMFMNQHYGIRFHLCDTNFNCIIGDVNIISRVEISFSEELSSDTGNEYDLSGIQLKNGLRFLVTGAYPLSIGNSLIKHIYVDNLTLLNKLHDEIYKFSAINSAILINDPTPLESPEFPCIYVDYYKITQDKLLPTSLYLPEHELQEMIHTFKSEGTIDNPSKIQGIIDYAHTLHIDRNNRLFYFSEGIYKDHRKTCCITEQLNSSFMSLLNRLSYISTKNANPLYDIFPLVLNISAHLQGHTSTFITPYSVYHVAQTIDKHKSLKFLGIVNDGKKFAYNVLNNKMYEVNDTFLHFLEYDLKENIDSEELKAKYSNHFPAIIKKFRSIVNA